MQLVEIRDLDGPNLFLLEPAIKVELKLDDGETQKSLADVLEPGSASLHDAASRLIARLHTANGLPVPRVVTRVMDDADHISIAFTWQRRAFSMAVAQQVTNALLGVVDDNINKSLRDSLSDRGEDDVPSWIQDKDRSALAISVTGTNGKTSTTRLIAHIMRSAGFRTGWNSSSGIYIDGVEIEAGDYSGPSGARRILQDPGVQVAVLETARGGILLRGLGYEHNDVSVFTNISADHLDLQGVKTLETLAEVKAVVCRVTKPNGVVVANADDRYVLAALADVSAPLTLFSRLPDSPIVRDQKDRGGVSIVASGDKITLSTESGKIAEFSLASIPMTHNGRALHMVENAMAAIGAALGAGLTVAQIREGLRSFRNDAVNNPGRLNIYKCDGVTVVLDFAHNEAGLKYLVEFGKGDLAPGGRLISIIGTAGDRTDESLFELGRIGAEESDLVIGKGTTKYLRGRSLESIMERYRSGAGTFPSTPYVESENEVTALQYAMAEARSGDVIVMMVHEHIPELEAILRERCTA